MECKTWVTWQPKVCLSTVVLLWLTRFQTKTRRKVKTRCEGDSDENSVEDGGDTERDINMFCIVCSQCQLSSPQKQGLGVRHDVQYMVVQLYFTPEMSQKTKFSLKKKGVAPPWLKCVNHFWCACTPQFTRGTGVLESIRYRVHEWSQGSQVSCVSSKKSCWQVTMTSRRLWQASSRFGH